MMRPVRFRLWALAFDACSVFGLPFPWALRCVRGMSDATDWRDA
jgi:hypothetical protein